jgi:uncharacterized protein (TIGR00369 family)
MPRDSDPSAAGPDEAGWDVWAEWAERLPVSRQIGLRCTRIEAGRATLVLARSSLHLTPVGAVHGGLVVACADHCFGIVAMTVLDADHVPATATLTSDFLRPALAPLTFDASVDRAGRTLLFVTVCVRDRDSKTAAKVNGTMVIDGTSRYAGSSHSPIAFPPTRLPRLSPRARIFESDRFDTEGTLGAVVNELIRALDRPWATTSADRSKSALARPACRRRRVIAGRGCPWPGCSGSGLPSSHEVVAPG